MLAVHSSFSSLQVLLVALALAPAVACGCGPREAVGLDADDDFACDVDNDCVAAYFGDVCRPGCPNGAVHVDARAAYDERFASEQGACTSVAPVDNDACITDVVCLSSRCLLRGG